MNLPFHLLPPNSILLLANKYSQEALHKTLLAAIDQMYNLQMTHDTGYLNSKPELQPSLYISVNYV